MSCTVLKLMLLYGDEWNKMSLSEKINALEQYIYGEKK